MTHLRNITVFAMAAIATAATCMLARTPAVAAPPTARSFGLEFATSDDFAMYPKLRVSRALTKSERGKRLEMTEYLPPIANQGETSSCVGWSTAYYCFTYSIGKIRGFTKDELNNPKYMFSPNYIWDQYNRGKPENGMHIFQAMDVLAKQGCCSLNEMPWDETGQAQPTQTAMTRAALFKARQTVSLFVGPPNDPMDPEKLKTVLWETKMPVVLGIMVYDDLGGIPNDPNFVYSPGPGAKPQGGHAVCIVGYDDDKHAFRMVNSWGSDWGDNGFVWLAEDFLAKCAREGWTQTPGGPRSRAVDGKPETLLHYKELYIEPAEKSKAVANP
ncbi:MAG TPA: C1 family peptidase [Capsulimonadaceae bacterium]|jgi:hypothetical protein